MDSPVKARGQAERTYRPYFSPSDAASKRSYPVIGPVNASQAAYWLHRGCQSAQMAKRRLYCLCSHMLPGVYIVSSGQDRKYAKSYIAVCLRCSANEVVLRSRLSLTEPSMTTPDDTYPLRRQNTFVWWPELRALGETIWNWTLCHACEPQQKCDSDGCPWSKRDDLGFFWRYYRSMTSSYRPQADNEAVLASHDDLLAIVRSMKAHPEWTRTQLVTSRFPQPAQPLVEEDRIRAVEMAVSVVFVMKCGYKTSDTNDMASFKWRDDWKLSEITTKAFPSGPALNTADPKDAQRELNPRAEFSAANLKKKIAGLRFETTDDLRCHLRFDKETRILQVFQGTAVMKQVLLATLPGSGNYCFVPRALAVEVCDTIYNLLFFRNDEAAQRILEGLERNHGFDSDLYYFDSASHQLDTERDDTYPYFGHRLNVLLKEMQDPSPANWFERLFETGEKSAGRRMLMLTVMGVFVTAVSSVLNLIVASYQAYVGYRQWQSQGDKS